MEQIRRAAELTVTAECMRAASLRGEQIDPLALVRLENLATHAVAALGLDRKREPVHVPMPSLASRLIRR